jgi:hypothetical protein
MQSKPAHVCKTPTPLGLPVYVGQFRVCLSCSECLGPIWMGLLSSLTKRVQHGERGGEAKQEYRAPGLPSGRNAMLLVQNKSSRAWNFDVSNSCT